jgi:hypothetical protein
MSKTRLGGHKGTAYGNYPRWFFRSSAAISWRFASIRNVSCLCAFSSCIYDIGESRVMEGSASSGGKVMHGHLVKSDHVSLA